MRKLLIILALPFISLLGTSQTHHIDDTVVTLIKTTDHSPIHWYTEIFNDCGVDTTLRWKASFRFIPAAWTINFDDQDNYHPLVIHEDSADFTLFGGLALPQKLIVGAELAGVPANCSATFKVYDPNNPNDSSHVKFEFNVTPGASQVPEFNFDDHYSFERGYILFSDLNDFTISLIGIDGRLITSTDFNTSNRIRYADLPNGTYLIKATKDNLVYSTKIAW